MTLGFIGAAAAALLIGGSGLTKMASGPLLDPASHARLEAGFALYRDHCSGCHGRYLAGAKGWQQSNDLAPALNETGHGAQHSDEDLFQRVALGARARGGRVTMPAYRGVLSDDEIISVLSYVVAWWPEETLRQRANANAVFPADCVSPPAEAARPADGN